MGTSPWLDQFTAPGTVADVDLRLAIAVTSQSGPLNQSTLAWSLRLVKNSVGGFPERGYNDCVAEAKVNGTVYSATNLNYDLPAGTQNVLVASGNRTVTHMADGTRTIVVGASYNGRNPLGTASISDTFTLPPIPRNKVKYGRMLPSPAWIDAEIYYGVNGVWVPVEPFYGVAGEWVGIDDS